MILHLPILQVVVPLLAAPICAMLPRGRWAWGWTTLTLWATLAISILLIGQTAGGEVLSYALGGWKPPMGIEYRLDSLSSYVLLLISLIAAVAIVFALRSVEHEIIGDKHSVFYAVFLLCVAGLLGIVSTNDAFNIYVFLEISSLATYSLIAMGTSRKSLLASYEYLILGTIGATFYLIGVGLLYMMTGTLNMTDLATRIIPLMDSYVLKAAIAFITLGLGLKIALFPLHLWLSNAYAYAPSFISIFLSATATKVSIYVLVRFIFMLFGVKFAFDAIPLDIILLTLGCFAVIVGSLVAIYQTNVKRMLAFSSIAQIGYIILGISLANASGLTAALVHLINHAFAKSALFMVMGCVALRFSDCNISHIAGLAKQMPLTMAAFIVAGLSLVGVPGTAGFISKWYLVVAAIDSGQWLVLLVVLMGSLLAIIYIWRIVELAYFQASTEKYSVKEAPISMLIPLWLMVAASVICGIYTAPTLGLAENAVNYILAFGGA